MTKRFCDWCGREIPDGPLGGRVVVNHPTGMDDQLPILFTDDRAPYGVQRFELCAEGADSCWQTAARTLALVKEDVEAGAVRG